MTTHYDALLVMGFGGPTSAEQVEPFLRHVTGGRITPQRMARVSEHYAHFGGVSPLNGQNRRLAGEVGERLRARGLDVPVALAHAHVAPFPDEVLARLAARGHRRVLTLVPAAYSSYVGCRSYREALAAAIPVDADGAPLLEVAKINPFHDLPALIDAQVHLLGPVVRAHPGARVLFTTHSLPIGLAETSGVGGGAYLAQHEYVIDRILAGLAEQGPSPDWELCYTSQGGAPGDSWLAPDVSDVIDRLAGQGVEEVVAVSIGFLSDHMEVIWDLDNEAAQTARGHGMGFHRVPTVGNEPVFLDGLADLVARGLAGEDHRGDDDCGGADCCPNPGGAVPAVRGVTP